MTVEEKVYESSIIGGLSPQEAQHSAELSSEMLEESEYDAEDIPALGAYIQQTEETDYSLPATEIGEYFNLLIDNPGEIVSFWDLEHSKFEALSPTIRAKRDEYTIRTLYALREDLGQETIDDSLRTLVNQADYKTNSNGDSGELERVIGQYISEIEQITQNEEIINQSYNQIGQTPQASATAAANIKAENLPNQVQNQIFVGGKEISENRINTRLRNMVGAGKCTDLEEKHEETLLAEEPSKENTLISIDNMLIGSLKHNGDESMIGLRDLQYEGRQVLQKGMAYRISHTSKEEIEEGLETFGEWKISEPDSIDVRPLRFAGSYHVDFDQFENFRSRIDKKREKLEQDTLLL